MRYNTTTLLLIGAVVALLFAVFYLYQKKENLDLNVDVQKDPDMPKTQPDNTVAPNQAPVQNLPPVLVLFHATWCPHCKTVLPLWPQIKANLAGKLDVIDIESKDPEMAKHKIQGFPTIRFFPQGLNNVDVYVDHTGPRTVEGIMQFLASLSKPN